MIRGELVKLLRRPRTWVAIAMLNALPTLVAVLLAVTDLGPSPGTGPPFLSAVLTDETLFPLAALGIVLPLFLPIAVAVIGGEAIAGEAQTGTLRYLLIRPVSRTHLLVAKLVSVVAFVLLTVVIVAVVGYVVGQLFLGEGTPTPGVASASASMSGTTLSSTEVLQRTGLALAYLTLSMLGVAALALLLSTTTDSAIGAALGTVGFLIASTVLLGLDAADALQPWLPTRYWLAFVDLFRDPILWDDVTRGVLLQLAYLLVFTVAAWANFSTKDVTS
ncbi:MAG: ABC transporter permease [Ornithinimicrobium sp.]|uniref:ABC transporter permease n=1 Tax=Ornithinimicrobium sp. TaxID=1977084 RepID=UPI003D9B5521